MGERTPIWDPAAEGDDIRLNPQPHAGSYNRALLESAGYGLKHHMDSSGIGWDPML
ncbi:hypothetical protein KEJ44_00385 [Candidatus Bathyarchaeota archaeon]|nr:hypothetical protein [Candidatus Bathyarchaeota archaeon]